MNIAAIKLNDDIRELLRKVKQAEAMDVLQQKEYNDVFETVIKTEFIRLYYTPRCIELINCTSLKTLLRLNLRYRFIALHRFGMEINL